MQMILSKCIVDDNRESVKLLQKSCEEKYYLLQNVRANVCIKS